MADKQQYWEITGWDSTTKIYETKVKHGCFNENQIKTLLRVLTAKHALTDNEIVSSYARSNTKIATPLLLEVQRYKNPYSFSCGTNPYFVAHVK